VPLRSKAGFEEMDYRRSEIGRKRSWYGLKRHVKKVLSLRLPHALLRGVVRFMPGLRQGGRLPAPASLREVEGRVAGTRFVMLRPDRCVVAKELYWGHGQRPRPEDHFAVELFARVAKRSDIMLDVGAYTGLFTPFVRYQPAPQGAAPPACTVKIMYAASLAFLMYPVSVQMPHVPPVSFRVSVRILKF
jgi:hypothetical protein